MCASVSPISFYSQSEHFAPTGLQARDLEEGREGFQNPCLPIRSLNRPPIAASQTPPESRVLPVWPHCLSDTHRPVVQAPARSRTWSDPFLGMLPLKVGRLNEANNASSSCVVGGRRIPGAKVAAIRSLGLLSDLRSGSPSSCSTTVSKSICLAAALSGVAWRPLTPVNVKSPLDGWPTQAAYLSSSRGFGPRCSVNEPVRSRSRPASSQP